MGGGGSWRRWDGEVRNERRVRDARIGDKRKLWVLADNVDMGRCCGRVCAAEAIGVGIIAETGGTGKLGIKEEERMLG